MRGRSGPRGSGERRNFGQYGLSTRECVAWMCLAEALLRVPDTETIDALIEDKIGVSDWAFHLGHSISPLVNASTWTMLLTGKVLLSRTLNDHEFPGLFPTTGGLISRIVGPFRRCSGGM